MVFGIYSAVWRFLFLPLSFLLLAFFLFVCLAEFGALLSSTALCLPCLCTQKRALWQFGPTWGLHLLLEARRPTFGIAARVAPYARKVLECRTFFCYRCLRIKRPHKQNCITIQLTPCTPQLNVGSEGLSRLGKNGLLFAGLCVEDFKRPNIELGVEGGLCKWRIWADGLFFRRHR